MALLAWLLLCVRSSFVDEFFFLATATLFCFALPCFTLPGNTTHSFAYVHFDRSLVCCRCFSSRPPLLSLFSRCAYNRTRVCVCALSSSLTLSVRVCMFCIFHAALRGRAITASCMFWLHLMLNEINTSHLVWIEQSNRECYDFYVAISIITFLRSSSTLWLSDFIVSKRASYKVCSFLQKTKK